MTEGTKRCKKCGQELPLYQFYASKNSRGGLRATCKACCAYGQGKNYLGRVNKDFPVPEGYKQCCRCGEIKLLSEFNFSKRTHDGYRGTCKACIAALRGRIYKPKAREGFRYCSKCGQEFPATREYFYSARDGLRGDCKECFLAQSSEHQRQNRERTNEKNRRWRERNIEKARESARRGTRRWREANPEAANEKTRRWRANNMDKVRAYDKAYTEVNREAIRQRHRKYKQAHQGIISEQSKLGKHRYKARKRNLAANFTRADWHRALEFWDHKCAICGRSADAECSIAADHWIPLTYHGVDNPGTVVWNILPLCHGIRGCNNHKCNRNPVEWLIEKLGEEAAMQKLAEIQAYFDFVKARQDKEK